MYDKKEALEYHEFPLPGKTATALTKPCETQKDLSLAYSPGVAEPCLAIAENPDDAFRYTNKGNLVAVISDGSAALGLGNIGPLAAKPIMEGKCVLFKKFANIDAVDIELALHDVDDIVNAVKALSPSFGGVNLEDISAPRCFDVERRLIDALDIPVFHDDQHGTAIISGAALLNACEIAGKDIKNVRMVINGAGAAGIASARLYLALGVPIEHIAMFDRDGFLCARRKEALDEHKRPFAHHTDAKTLAQALDGADVFIGLSVKNALDGKAIQRMADNPIIFALANPDPEIPYEEAKAARPDAILATGRTDYPNQVNNALGFPGIFRGALDVRARKITLEMKRAAVTELANLAKAPVPESALTAYGIRALSFGRDYIIPKPFDPRVIACVAPAVAKAAMESGVARVAIDIDAYRKSFTDAL